MMMYLSLCIILILLVIVCVQYRGRIAQSIQIRTISEQLDNMITQQSPKQESSEKVLLVTGDPTIQMLLIKINELLDINLKARADYAKSQVMMTKMLSNISHDLKTPLTVVFGYVEALLHHKQITPEESLELLQKVYQKTEQTIGLIDTFFNLAKLESGDTVLKLTRLDIGEVCRWNVLQFYDLLSANNFNVHIDLPDTPLYILGNEEALNRILHNLISNAIRYGSDGNVLGISLKEEGEDVNIEVWDRGRGIQEAHKDLVFERMYTLDDSRNKSGQGSGLGLTIVKRLVHAMNGSIHLTSKPYEQTVFSVGIKKVD